ncbi:MAG: PLP-dependent aminotransferase family protein [Desulfocapsaceae bacterium]|nr:PLP-dependent aminotransferase family protein [Desulfocapsaceae bacterium]
MKRATEREIALGPRQKDVSLQRWLYSELRDAILTGRLEPGARLPASRELARRLRISRGTVLVVFDQLAAEGYLKGSVGRGSFVAPALPELSPMINSLGFRPDAESDADKERRQARSKITLSSLGKRLARTPFQVEGRRVPARAFRPNQPDLAAFPFDLWKRIVSSQTRSLRRDTLADGEALGFRPLRTAIAQHLRTARGIFCSADNVAIVGSIQQVFDLIVRLVLDPGDEVWMEDPGYPGARQIFEAAGAKIAAVPVDEGGMDVLAGCVLAPNAKLVYITAGRQAPLGPSLALDRRLKLLAWAQKSGAVIIEDDYDSEYRFEGAPLAALKSLDRNENVVYCGTFSKLLFPALRIAYAVLPESLVEPFTNALSLSYRHPSLLPQTALHEFIAEGHFGRHIRKMRLLYSERAQALQEAARISLRGLLDIPPITIGLDTPAFLTWAGDDAAIASKAAEGGIESRPLSVYSVRRPAPPGLLLGFAAVEPAVITTGAVALARVLESLIEFSPRKVYF